VENIGESIFWGLVVAASGAHGLRRRRDLGDLHRRIKSDLDPTVPAERERFASAGV
jgi:hypothetical protein